MHIKDPHRPLCRYLTDIALSKLKFCIEVRLIFCCKFLGNNEVNNNTFYGDMDSLSDSHGLDIQSDLCADFSARLERRSLYTSICQEIKVF